MDKRIIVLNSGVDKKEIADKGCCPTGVSKIREE